MLHFYYVPGHKIKGKKKKTTQFVTQPKLNSNIIYESSERSVAAGIQPGVQEVVPRPKEP